MTARAPAQDRACVLWHLRGDPFRASDLKLATGTAKWGFREIGGPLKSAPRVVGVPYNKYNKDPNKVPLISETPKLLRKTLLPVLRFILAVEVIVILGIWFFYQAGVEIDSHAAGWKLDIPPWFRCGGFLECCCRCLFCQW